MKKKRGDEIKLTTSLLSGDTVMPAMHHLFSCIFQTQRAQFVPLFVFSSSVNRIHLPSAPCTHSVHTQNLIFTKSLNETCLTRVQVQDTERELLPLPLLFFFFAAFTRRWVNNAQCVLSGGGNAQGGIPSIANEAGRQQRSQWEKSTIAFESRLAPWFWTQTCSGNNRLFRKKNKNRTHSSITKSTSCCVYAGSVFIYFFFFVCLPFSRPSPVTFVCGLVHAHANKHKQAHTHKYRKRERKTKTYSNCVFPHQFTNLSVLIFVSQHPQVSKVFHWWVRNESRWQQILSSYYKMCNY